MLAPARILASVAVSAVLLASFICPAQFFFLNRILPTDHCGLFVDNRGHSRKTTLWAWDCPEDLRFLKGTGTEVAFYAGTLFLEKDGTRFIPRMKPLLVDHATKTYPVFRIESRVDSPPKEFIGETVATISGYVNVHPTEKIQLDYDATESERKFYLELLKRLRTQLGAKRVISVTALASWCLDDRWLDHAPIDEAVVMLFSMGPGGRSVIDELAKEDLRVRGTIRLSLGVSANEPATNMRLKQAGVLAGNKPIFLFNSLPWSYRRYQDLTARILTR
jgi:hypothetical protein